GVGSMAIGVALMVVGVFAGGASAQTQQSGDDDRLTCAPEQGFHFRWGLDSAGPTVDENGFVDVSGLAGGGETTVSNGDVTVTLSDAAFLVNGFEGWAGPEYRIKSLKFELTQGAATAVIVRLWEDIGVYSFVKVPITGTSGEIASPEGSHEILGQAPIKGLEFCYEA